MMNTTTAALRAAVTALTLGTAGRAAIVHPRSTIPLLQCVLLCASDAGAPVIEGCSLDLSASTTLPGTASRGFRVAVDGRALKAAVAKLKAKEVELTDLGGSITLRSADGTGPTVKLATNSEAHDYPRVSPTAPAGVALSFPVEQFATDLGRLMTAMSKEETRYYLNGVFMHRTGDGQLAMATTDGHRLVRVSRPAPAGTETVADTIIPAEAVALLSRVTKKGEGDVALTFHGVRLAIEANGWRIVTKTVDGTFPDYTRVIPCHNEHRVTVDTAALAQDVEALTAHQTGRHRNFTLSAGDGWATGWAVDVDAGSAGAVLESAEGTTTGAETFASFNAAYFTASLGLVKGKATIAMQDYGAPVRFEYVDAPELTAVLMPMRNADRAYTRDDVARLNMTAVERFEDRAPGLVGVELASMRADLRRLTVAAIEEKARDAVRDGADAVEARRGARLAILARLEAMAGEPGRATAQLEHQPRGEFAGNFAGWAAWCDDMTRFWRFHASEARAAVMEAAAPVMDGNAAIMEAMQRRERRLRMVLEGRKAQLAAVGQALARSQDRNAVLQRRVASAGSSSLAAAIADTLALQNAA
jgi:DNA polymerase-3 subunit beta